MTNIPILQFDTWRYFSSSLLFQTKTEWSKQAWVREIKRLLNLSEGKLQLLVLFCFCPVSGLVAILCSFPRKWIIGCLKYCSWQFAASVTEVTARMHFKDLCINLLRSFLSRVHELDNLVFGFTALVNGTKWMNLWKVWDNMKTEVNRRLVVHLAYALTCLINIYYVSWRHCILSFLQNHPSLLLHHLLYSANSQSKCPAVHRQRRTWWRLSKKLLPVSRTLAWSLR